MSSLSSVSHRFDQRADVKFQSTLKFNLPPSFKSTIPTPTPRSTSSSSSSSGLNMKAGKGDREMMPPPPADYITKTRARSRSDSPEKMRDLSPIKRKGDIHTYGKGKGKEINSDDDEIEVLGSSPGKPKKGDGEFS